MKSGEATLQQLVQVRFFCAFNQSNLLLDGNGFISQDKDKIVV